MTLKTRIGLGFIQPVTLQPLLHELRLSRSSSEFILGKSKAFVAGQSLGVATENLESELAASALSGVIFCRFKQGLSNALSPVA
jgi:hypothetical protein